jgi:Gas vesicle synthesis protein GvpL/GvpF/DnaJ domain
MAEAQTYLYGVAAAGALRAPLRAQGLPDGQGPVTAITVGGAAAIIGRHEGTPAGGLSQPELLRRLAIHQRVIEDAMSRGDVLPARFGTVLASEEEVRSFLARWGGLVRDSLARYCGLVEVEAAATWDLGRTIAEIACEPEVVAAKAAAQQASQQHRLARQVKVGQLVKLALDRRRARYQEMLLQEVSSLAKGIMPNAVLADELVFNVAFLLERHALGAFDAAIERLDAALAGSLSFRRIGPLPPYSFATVTVTRFDAERLAAGRALLGIPGEISEQAVLSSYRRLARQMHPDHHPADPTAAQRFAALSAAKTDLLAYCGSRMQGDQAGSGPTLMVVIQPSGNGSAPGEDRDD